MKYAQDTEVPVDRSKAEIEATLRRYGASGFMSAWQGNQAMIAFEMKDRRIKFLLPLPDPKEQRFTHSRVNQGTRVKPRPPAQALAAWEQACRQRWRALALAIKAKLEAVDSGISHFEEEFLAHIVMANGMTAGERLVPRLGEMVATGKLPNLLTASTKEQS